MNNMVIILMFNIETPNFKPLTPDTHHSILWYTFNPNIYTLVFTPQ